MSTVVRLSDVTYSRSSTTILDSVTWQVNEGEHWVIVGANGAGKTTLSRMVSARLHPTSGSVEILDEYLDEADVTDVRPRIGLASAALAGKIEPQARVLDLVLTASYGQIHRWQEDYDELDTGRASALLTALGAGDLQERQWGTLSSGERKRVELARALMPDPELLVLDEPAAGLDVGGRELLVSALAEIVTDPASPTILLVTHHLEEIPAGFTHALVLKHGRVLAAGPVAEVLTDATMSEAFDVPLTVTQRDGRFSAQGVLTPRQSQHAKE